MTLNSTQLSFSKEISELCSLSEFARNMHQKNTADISTLPQSIRIQFVNTSIPLLVTPLTAEAMSDLARECLKQDLTQTVDFLMEQEYLIQRYFMQENQEIDKNAQYSLDEEINELKKQMEIYKEMLTDSLETDKECLKSIQRKRRRRQEQQEQEVEEEQPKQLKQQNNQFSRKDIFQFMMRNCHILNIEKGNIQFEWKLDNSEIGFLRNLAPFQSNNQVSSADNLEKKINRKNIEQSQELPKDSTIISNRKAKQQHHQYSKQDALFQSIMEADSLEDIFSNQAHLFENKENDECQFDNVQSQPLLKPQEYQECNSPLHQVSHNQQENKLKEMPQSISKSKQVIIRDNQEGKISSKKSIHPTNIKGFKPNWEQIESVQMNQRIKM